MYWCSYLYCFSLWNKQFFAYVNHARICSWKQPVLSNESSFLLKETTKRAFDRARTHDWQVSTDHESDYTVLIYCFTLTWYFQMRLLWNRIKTTRYYTVFYSRPAYKSKEKNYRIIHVQTSFYLIFYRYTCISHSKYLANNWT